MSVNWISGKTNYRAVILRGLAAAICLALPSVSLGARDNEGPDIRRDAAVNAVEQVMPSVVNIATETIIQYHDFYEDLLRDFYGRPLVPRQQRSMELGSGIIIDEEGYILTNFHVVRRATRIQVKLWDGREYNADPIVATPHNDVALLKMRAKPGERFQAARLAADDDLLLGETVLALGNPFGLGGTVTKGILSSKTRRPDTGDEPLNVNDWLQTDAAINPGNSGGPLVNLRGEVIGLNVAVYRGQGIGFSIPVKQVSEALSHFFSPELTDSLWFGARMKPGRMPLEVTAVQPESPVGKAGLRAGDQILQVNGKQPAGLIPFNRMLCDSKDRSVQILVRQGSEQRTLKVSMISFEEMIRQKVGLTLLELTPQIAASLGAKTDDGLFVEEVEKGGPADRARIQRGQLLARIDNQTTGNLMAVADALSAKKKGELARLTVLVPRRLGTSFVGYQPAVAEVPVR